MDEDNIVDKFPKRKSKGHKCYLCGQRFMSVNILRKHVNIHKDRDMECTVCGKTYSSQCGLKKHMLFHTGERPFKCTYCGKAFRQKCTLLSHIECMHNSSRTKHYCSTCGKRLRSAKQLQCWFCRYGKIFPADEKDPVANLDLWTQDEAQNSTSEINGSATDVSESGLAVSENSNSLELTLQVGSSESLRKPFLGQLRQTTCLMCGESFPSVIELRQHTTDVHKDSRLFMCDLCGNRFSTQMSLSNHLLTHEENRPFMCLTCGKCFKSQVTLQSHLNTHREDRPYGCKLCKSTFKTVLALKTHAVTHQSERPFVCKVCGYPFKTLDRLKKHVIVHTDERPYKCDACPKEFKHPGNLGRHYYLHVGQRLFICRICGKDFAQSGGLKQHEQVHDKKYEESKKLSCPLCNKAYKLEVMLQRHLISHQ